MSYAILILTLFYKQMCAELYETMLICFHLWGCTLKRETANYYVMLQPINQSMVSQYAICNTVCKSGSCKH